MLTEAEQKFLKDEYITELCVGETLEADYDETYTVLKAFESTGERSRWHTDYEMYFRRESDKTIWCLSQRIGSTEMQDNDDPEFHGPYEMFERTVVDFRPIK